ncbi:hypothetical protein DFJ73DRAFT_913285 [Zopfochytrium polystomum]|nr:hypothetical protein DFJ73DRAFT_913285 [Zopfochytrium polystomum]
MVDKYSAIVGLTAELEAAVVHQHATTTATTKAAVATNKQRNKTKNKENMRRHKTISKVHVAGGNALDHIGRVGGGRTTSAAAALPLSPRSSERRSSLSAAAVSTYRRKTAVRFAASPTAGAAATTLQPPSSRVVSTGRASDPASQPLPSRHVVVRFAVAALDSASQPLPPRHVPSRLAASSVLCESSIEAAVTGGSSGSGGGFATAGVSSLAGRRTVPPDLRRLWESLSIPERQTIVQQARWSRDCRHNVASAARSSAETPPSPPPPPPHTAVTPAAQAYDEASLVATTHETLSGTVRKTLWGLDVAAAQTEALVPDQDDEWAGFGVGTSVGSMADSWEAAHALVDEFGFGV